MFGVIQHYIYIALAIGAFMVGDALAARNWRRAVAGTHVALRAFAGEQAHAGGVADGARAAVCVARAFSAGARANADATHA